MQIIALWCLRRGLIDILINLTKFSLFDGSWIKGLLHLFHLCFPILLHVLILLLLLWKYVIHGLGEWKWLKQITLLDLLNTSDFFYKGWIAQKNIIIKSLPSLELAPEGLNNQFFLMFRRHSFFWRCKSGFRSLNFFIQLWIRELQFY